MRIRYNYLVLHWAFVNKLVLAGTGLLVLGAGAPQPVTAAATGTGTATVDVDIRVPEYIVIDNPLGFPNSLFGQGNCFADIDGDGDQDLAVGAPGLGLVFFIHNVGTPTLPDFKWLGFRTGGFGSETADQAGLDLWAADLDGNGTEEVVFGAPGHTVGGIQIGAVYVYDFIDDATTQLVSNDPNALDVGTSVTLGDFDGDGYTDLAAGAPGSSVHDGTSLVPAGKVVIWFGSDTLWGEHVIDNPNPVPNGNFGHEVAVTQGGGGLVQLAVSAVGNSDQGITFRGGAYVFGPLIAEARAFTRLGSSVPPAPRHRPPVMLGDPDIVAGDPIVRWGMSLFARGPWVGVGAPRKNWGGLQDTGVGYLFHWGGFRNMEYLHNPLPTEFDLNGLDSTCANVIGGDAPDLIFSHVRKAEGGGGLPRSLMVWDGDTFEGPVVFQAADNAGHHCFNEMDYAVITDSAYEAITQGDGRWNSPTGDPEVGRLTIMLPADD